jgi:glycosyltransferase involved in cell wall biosynthesis
MKILMLTPFVPYPPVTGGTMRVWEQIKYLGQRHQLTVACYCGPQEGEIAFQEEMRRYCEQVFMVKHVEPDARDRPADLPRLVHKLTGNGEMRKTLERIESVEFDVALVDTIWMAQFQDTLKTRTVLQEHNIESSVIRQFADLYHNPEKEMDEQGTWAITILQNANQEWRNLADYEKQMWPKFRLRIAVSENDREVIDRVCMPEKTVVVENGINVSDTARVNYRHANRKVLFMGNLDYYPNIDGVFYYIRHILPELWAKDPSISLCIAGRNPGRALRKLGSERRIEVIADPDDMSAVGKTCGLTIVPLRFGGGTRIKILHSMAMGLPVVSTSIGCEGLSITDGTHILVRDTPRGFAEGILQIFSDQEVAERLRHNGRILVERRYDWCHILKLLEAEMLAVC